MAQVQRMLSQVAKIDNAAVTQSRIWQVGRPATAQPKRKQVKIDNKYAKIASLREPKKRASKTKKADPVALFQSRQKQWQHQKHY